MEKKIQKVIEKYKMLLFTLKENKALKESGDHYPYELDIKLTKEVINDLDQCVGN